MLLTVLALQGCAATMLTAPCDNPRVSNSSLPHVYVVMLPYVYRGTGKPVDAYIAAAKTLNSLAGLEAVRMAAETTDVHVTLLEDNGSGCGIEYVFGAFAKPALQRKVLSSVVFYWGEIFEDDDRILVQSHVRVLWKSESEKRIHLDVYSGNDSAALRFSGHVPYATISFPPRSLPLNNELGGDAQLKKLFRGKASPRQDAEWVPIPPRFVIVGRKDEWIELRSLDTSQTVWVSVISSGNMVRSILPELSFAHALAAYMNHHKVPQVAVAKDVLHWLTVFRQGYTDEGDPFLRKPSALADVIEGALAMARRDGDTTLHGRRATELLDQATLLLPDNSAVLNLAAMSNIRQCCTTKEAAVKIQNLLEHARKLHSGDEEIAANLLAWYRLLETKDTRLWPYDVDDIRRRAKALEEILR